MEEMRELINVETRRVKYADSVPGESVAILLRWRGVEREVRGQRGKESSRSRLPIQKPNKVCAAYTRFRRF